MRSKDSEAGGLRPLPETRWFRSLSAAGLQSPEVNGPARYWLGVEGSFTRALQQQCREAFHVEVCGEGFAHPSAEEARRLGLPARQQAWIREVRLCGDHQPWVLARTVIPVPCLEDNGRQLRSLGSRPLGAYLFSSPDWNRGPLEVGICRPAQPGQPRLARRSLFHCRRQALMVCEYLLPALYQPPGPL